MKRKTIIDLISSVCLIVFGSIILSVPFMKGINVKYFFIGILAFYGIANLIQFIINSKDKEYEGIFVMVASIIALILLGFLEVENNVINLSLTLFVWIVLIALIKFRKSNKYQEDNKAIWGFRIVTLILFILMGLVTVINLYYESTIQVIVLGYFCFIHGILELVEPITNYLLDK